MSDFVNLNTNMPFISQYGADSYKKATWISMMGKSFKEADVQRKALVENGPWTARTDSIQRYSKVDVYF